MVHVRPADTVASALRCSDAGMSDVDNAARHGVAVKTVRRWRRLYQREGRQRGQQHLAPPCPRCDGADLDDEAYSELLGWYLGDGTLTAQRRGVFGLHVVDDARYVHDIERITELMRRVKPGGRPHRRDRPGAVLVTVSWKHWPCLFPQHGPGRKHDRRIELVPWQVDAVRAHPGPFLRGLFHSDGSRVANWATRAVDGRTVRHEYPRWQFSNRSEDLLGICTWALDLAGIAWRRSSAVHVSVSRREAVRRLDDLVGPKS